MSDDILLSLSSLSVYVLGLCMVGFWVIGWPGVYGALYIGLGVPIYLRALGVVCWALCVGCRVLGVRC